MYKHFKRNEYINYNEVIFSYSLFKFIINKQAYIKARMDKEDINNDN